MHYETQSQMMLKKITIQYWAWIGYLTNLLQIQEKKSMLHPSCLISEYNLSLLQTRKACVKKTHYSILDFS